ncbi:hypothetical protein [Sphingobacterium sp. 1.A.4]|uniref:hypothetical protein n=1 Tax=Sphingobacterium sp. 1.A.4 TaxID=2044603 RepID=UPI000C0BDB48|nr:hypothetical protein [Sphingobacterium sp. 1.A.4]
MLNKNIIREIISNTRFQFLIGIEYFGSEPERRIYDSLFEAGIEWLFSYRLGKPKPKVVYCENFNFLKKEKFDIYLHHNLIKETIRNAIFLRPEEYLHFKKCHNLDELIETEFNKPFYSTEGLRFDLFNTISRMLYQLEKSSFNLVELLREVMEYTICKSIHQYDAYSKNLKERFLVHEESLQHARNLCNAEIFHVFFGKNVVYALRYPYFKFSQRKKLTSLLNGSGGESSFKTFLPRFYWPYGPKIYASETQVLPSWIFNEYMQEGYFRKIMDVNDIEIRDGLVGMIKRDKGNQELFDFIQRNLGDNCIAAYYYLLLTDKKTQRDEVFLNSIIARLTRGEIDKNLRNFIEAGFGKEEIVEYYMRYFKIEKVWELLS